jgi:hypothetical protein
MQSDNTPSRCGQNAIQSIAHAFDDVATYGLDCLAARAARKDDVAALISQARYSRIT